MTTLSNADQVKTWPQREQALRLITAMGPNWVPPQGFGAGSTWTEVAAAAHAQAKPEDYERAITAHDIDAKISKGQEAAMDKAGRGEVKKWPLQEQVTRLYAAIGDRWQSPEGLTQWSSGEQWAAAAHAQARPEDYERAVATHNVDKHIETEQSTAFDRAGRDDVQKWPAKEQALRLVAAMGEHWQPPQGMGMGTSWDEFAKAANAQARPEDYARAIASHDCDQQLAQRRDSRAITQTADVER